MKFHKVTKKFYEKIILGKNAKKLFANFTKRDFENKVNLQ